MGMELGKHFGKITPVVFTVLLIIVSSIFYGSIFEQAEALPYAKQDLLYLPVPLSEDQIKQCEALYDDYKNLQESDFNQRYLYHKFARNCVMLFEDPIWDYDGMDRYEKLSEKSAEYVTEMETASAQRKKSFFIDPISVIELKIPGSFLFTFKGCTGDQFVNIEEAVVVSDKEVVQLSKYKAIKRVVPPGVCNILEVQIKADDPNSIRVLIPSLSVDVEAKIEESKKNTQQTEPNSPNKVIIVTGDLSHKAGPLDEKNIKECENIHQDYLNLDENNFNTKYLYHEFVGDCVLLYEDSVWKTIESSNIGELNQRLDDLRKQKDNLRKGEFQPFSITPRSIEEISDGLHMYTFEGCTGDEFVNVENAVISSDAEVISLVSTKREENMVPPGICKVFDIKIRADDPSSIRVVLPMMAEEGEMENKVTTSEKHMSPRAQIKSGIALDKISCKTGFEFLLKSSNGSPACVKEFNLEKLIQRGWGKLA
jgi:hypothetical protein